MIYSEYFLLPPPCYRKKSVFKFKPMNCLLIKFGLSVNSFEQMHFPLMDPLASLPAHALPNLQELLSSTHTWNSSGSARSPCNQDCGLNLYPRPGLPAVDPIPYNPCLPHPVPRRYHFYQLRLKIIHFIKFIDAG